jgi:phage terminase large subunit-like protein
VPQTAGRRVAAFSQRFIRQTKGRWAGHPLHLEPWQRDLLDELYLLDESGDYVYREALLGVARKNGKSTLAAAIGLYGLIASGENAPEVYSAAASKDQARVVFDQAKAFVQASPLLQDWLKPMRSVITCPANGGVYRVLSSDAPLQHGLNPSLVVIDELWAHRDPELYYALTTGQLARQNPLVISITTAGFDQDTICYEVYSRGLEIAAGGREAMRAQRFLFDWRQAPPSADITDELAWLEANPSSWINVDDLRRERERLPEHVFRRLHLNQWTAAEDSWLPVGAWEKCEDPGAVIPEGADVVLGVDLGLKHDLAAIAVVWRRDDGKTVVAGEVFEPPGKGESLSIARLESALRELAQRYHVVQVMYDPWRFERSAQMLAEEGLVMIEHPMTNERTAPASERLYEAIVSEAIVHDGDPTLAAHVAAGVTVDTERGWRLTKRKARHKIDLLMALLIAFNGAMTMPPPKRFDVSSYRIERL